MELRRQEFIAEKWNRFLVVAEQGSLSGAARKMGLDLGNLSRTLADLERSVGSALVVRHRSGLQLTEIGLRYRKALLAAQDDLVGRLIGRAVQRVRIGFSPAIGFNHFNGAYLRRMRDLGLQPEFRLEASTVLFELLKNRELDLVLAPRELQFPGVIRRRLAADHMVLCSRSGALQETVVINPQMFDLERLLKDVAYRHRWAVNDYFVLAKLLEEDGHLMGFLPDGIASRFLQLKRIRTWKNEGQIHAYTWPGSVGIQLLPK